MTRNKKIAIVIIITIIAVLAWAPWLNNQELHDKVFEERAGVDGTIDKDGNLICDYNVNWFPFGRYIASCEGGYFATFWGKILFPESVEVEDPCAVCINGCDTCPEGCEECLIGIEKKLMDPSLKWYYSPEGSQKLNEIIIPAFADDEPDTVINSLLQTLNDSSFDINFSEPKQLSQWWVSDDGWSISVPDALSIVSKDIRGSSVKPLDPKAKELNYFISSIFLANDFEPNATNTSKSEEEPWLEFYDYIVAFQKNETRCTLTTNGEAWEYFVTCSDSFQEAYEGQIAYLKALDRLDRRDVIVRVKERIGDFVWLYVNPRRTGSLALMKDDGKEVRFIFSGQEAPPCDLMIENQIPEEVYGICNDAWKSIRNNNNDQK